MKGTTVVECLINQFIPCGTTKGITVSVRKIRVLTMVQCWMTRCNIRVHIHPHGHRGSPTAHPVCDFRGVNRLQSRKTTGDLNGVQSCLNFQVQRDWFPKKDQLLWCQVPHGYQVPLDSPLNWDTSLTPVRLVGPSWQRSLQHSTFDR